MAVNGSAPTVPDYSFVQPFEFNHDRIHSQLWIAQNFHLPVISSVAYVFIVFSGQLFMRSRNPIEIKPVLVLWNAALALFSLAVSIRLLPELWHGIKHFGMKHSLCSFCFYDDSSVSAFWSFLFVISKLAELFDTLFLVLRKRKVVFLHWFHHCSVLVFTWFLLKDKAAIGRWFMNMNAVIHSIMYAYFTMAAIQVKISKRLAFCITTAQLMQMLMGSYISVQGFIFWLRGDKCDISRNAAISAIAIYSIYFILFLNFFMKNYFLKERGSKKKV